MSDYLMEHPLEAERLEIKTKKERILKEFEYIPLQRGMEVLDVGCGTGAVTRIIAGQVAPGQVWGLDISGERLESAKRIAEEKAVRNVHYLQGDVKSLEQGERRFDLVYSRCFFQYIPGQAGMDTLMGMKKLARPGGRVVVADIDGNTLYRYPLDKEWGDVLDFFLQALEKEGFDPYVGRKLFSMFHKAGFSNITVDILPYYLITGGADPNTLRVWEMKIEILKERMKKIFSSAEKAEKASDRFIADLKREDMLLYSFLFLVQGET